MENAVDREKVIKGMQESAAYFRSSFDAMYGTVACEKFRSWTDAIEQAIALLKAQEPRVTCSVCKYSRCLSGEWFCFMIGTSRYGKRVTDGDWYCKDAIGR